MGLYFIPELGYTLLWRYQATTLTGRQKHVKPVALSKRHVYVLNKIKTGCCQPVRQ